MKLTNSEWHLLNEVLALAEAQAVEHPYNPMNGRVQEGIELLAKAEVTDGFDYRGNSLLAQMERGFAV